MTGKQFRHLADALSRYSNPRNQNETMFVQSSDGYMKLVLGNTQHAMIVDAGEDTEQEKRKFFIHSRPFLALAKDLSMKSDVTLSTASGQLGVKIDGRSSRLSRTHGELDSIVKPMADYTMYVHIPHNGLETAWRMLTAMKNDQPISKHVSFAYADEMAYITGTSSYCLAAMALPSMSFEPGYVSQDFVEGWKVMTGPGSIAISKNRVQIRFGDLLAVATLYSGAGIMLERFADKPSDVVVTYDRKALIAALRGVASRDEFARATLACTPGGEYHVGGYLGSGDWLAVAASGTRFAQPKALSVSYALKLLAALEGKDVTLSWNLGLDTRLSPHYIHFTPQGMNEWPIICLAPVAMG